MALVVYDFEKIASSGAATVNDTTPAVGDFSPQALLITQGTGGSVKYSTVMAADGTMGLSVTPATSGACILRLQPSATSLTQSLRVVMKLPNRPTPAGTALTPFAVRNTADATIASLAYQSTGALELRGPSGAYFGTIVAAGNTNPGDVIDFSLRFVVGASTTDGTATATVYNHATQTQLGTYSSPSLNLGTLAADRINLGSSVAYTSETISFGYDSLQTEADRTTEIPQYSPPAATTTVAISPATATVFPGEGVVLTASTTGTIASYGWSTTGGTITGTGVSATFYCPPSRADATATVTCTVTDTANGTANATATISMKASEKIIKTSSGWSPVVNKTI